MSVGAHFVILLFESSRTSNALWRYFGQSIKITESRVAVCADHISQLLFQYNELKYIVVSIKDHGEFRNLIFEIRKVQGAEERQASYLCAFCNNS